MQASPKARNVTRRFQDLLRYFGDLDRAGLSIAARASQRAVELGLPGIQADLDLYRLLLEHGRAQAADGARPRGKDPTAELCSWLGDDDLEEAAAMLLSGGARLAQEQVGVELLMRLAADE